MVVAASASGGEEKIINYEGGGGGGGGRLWEEVEVRDTGDTDAAGLVRISDIRTIIDHH